MFPFAGIITAFIKGGDMRNVLLGCIILFGLLGGMFAQETMDSDYVIREEDVLSVIVRGEEEYTIRDRAVRMDGRIAMPSLGEIYVSGKTTQQLEAEITEKLKIFMRDPIVQIFLERTPSHRVHVAGKVGRPGNYALTGPTTVLEVLMSAGGPLDTAKVKNIRIIRNVNGREVQFRFNYKDVLQGKNLRQNIQLENRDWIMVP